MSSDFAVAERATSGSSFSTTMASTGAPSSAALGTPSSPALATVATASSSDVPLQHAIHSMAIKSPVPYRLDLQAHNYTKWHTLFLMVLGRFNLLHHVEDNGVHDADIKWTTENLLVGNWIYSTISENLTDMCLQLCSPTAHMIWVHLSNLFNGNKLSRVVHLECELHSLVQGEMSANDFCHRLQQLANFLDDCDAPISDWALVHQLIQGVNPKDSASTSSQVSHVHRGPRTHSECGNVSES
jgi:hypothetical protein